MLTEQQWLPVCRGHVDAMDIAALFHRGYCHILKSLFEIFILFID